MTTFEMRLSLFGGSRRENEYVLYACAFQYPAEKPFSLDMAFVTFRGFVEIITIPVA